jgi:hypothetical protein
MMLGASFTGNFVKPAETFALQPFDVFDLNRLPPKVLLGFLIVGAAGFALHFLVRTLPAVFRRRASP